MSESLLVGGWVVTGVESRERATVLRDAAVAHRDGKILEVGPVADMRRKYPHASSYGSPDHAVLPGFINSHHHCGLTPLQLGSLDYALELWMVNRMTSRHVDLYLDTLYSAFEMIASGTTTVQHLQGWWEGGPIEKLHAAASRVIDAYKTIGMRACYSMIIYQQKRLVYENDVDFIKRLPAEVGKKLHARLSSQYVSLDDHLKLFDWLQADTASDKLVRIALAPANLHWCTDEGLQSIKQKADRSGVPMHLHLLESAYQKEYARRRTGTTAVKHLQRLGVLGPNVTLGHAVWVNQEDIEICAATRTCICHNCSSNFRLRSGLAPLNAFEKHGLTVGMGVDEAGLNDDRDMLQEMRLALRVHRVPGMADEEVPSCAQVLRMATEHGALTTAFGPSIGKLEAGRFADASLINVKRAFYPYQDADVPMLDALLQRAKTEHVDAVFINGDMVYEHGRFTRVDREKVLGEIGEALSRPRSATDTMNRELRHQIFPYVREFYRNYLQDEPTRQPFYGNSSKN
jgi:cytosine/adenosine deaminase-related metal-dependent hydrolase